MPSRRRRAKMVKESMVTATATSFAVIYNKPATLLPTLTSKSEVLTENPAIVTTKSTETIRNLLFTIDNINTIIQFYDNAHERIFSIFDMMIGKRDINDIVASAKHLRMYMFNEIDKLNGLSGTTTESDLFDKCKYLVLDILDDIINQVESNILMRRIFYLREVIGQARIEYGL